jgi:hypothetical protein
MNGSFARSYGTPPGGSEPQDGPFPEALAKGKYTKNTKVEKLFSCGSWFSWLKNLF